MPPTCSKCEQEITDDTILCPACGHNVALEKAQRNVEILEGALSGWRRSAEQSKPEITELKRLLEMSRGLRQNAEHDIRMLKNERDRLKADLFERDSIWLPDRDAQIAHLREGLEGAVAVFPDNKTLDALDDNDMTGSRTMVLQRNPTIKDIREWRSALNPDNETPCNCGYLRKTIKEAVEFVRSYGAVYDTLPGNTLERENAIEDCIKKCNRALEGELEAKRLLLRRVDATRLSQANEHIAELEKH